MKKILKKYRDCFSRKEFVTSLILGIIIFTFSTIVHYQAGLFATKNLGDPLKDLLLGYLPITNVDIIFVEGIMLFWVLSAILILSKPEKIPFVLKSLGLFMLIRSAFIVMTQLGPPSSQPTWETNNIINKFTFEGDLFFSGHTGAPFLMSLIFWKNIYLRWVFLISSVFFGASVLLGHIHYSIDVFGAYFITFGIYHLALKFFAKDLC